MYNCLYYCNLCKTYGPAHELFVLVTHAQKPPLNTHVDAKFSQKLHLHLNFVYGSSEGSVDSVCLLHLSFMYASSEGSVDSVCLLHLSFMYASSEGSVDSVCLLHLSFMYASSEGSVDSVCLRRLIRAFIAQ